MYRVKTGLDILLTLGSSCGTLAEGREARGGKNAVAEWRTEERILKDCCVKTKSWTGECWGTEIV